MLTQLFWKRRAFSTHEVIGSIEGNDPDDLHVLTGLFVTNYYTQVGIAVFVAVFIPIWVSVIN